MVTRCQCIKSSRDIVTSSNSNLWGPSVTRGTTYSAVDGPARPSIVAIDSPAEPSIATKFSVGGLAGPVVEDPRKVHW